MSSDKKFVSRTYQLTREAVNILEVMTKRISKEARFDISMAKVVELIIHHSQKKSFHELTDYKKPTE